MDPVVAPAAPAAAPAAAPKTQTAVDAATASGKTSDFRAARRAERAGKPLAAVPVDATKKAAAAPAPPVADVVDEPNPAAPAQPGSTTSKRQQEINERVQRAADTATAQLREENDRLKAQLAGRETKREAPAAPAPPAAEAKTWQDAIQRPDVSQPMLDEAAFFAKYPEAPYAAYARYWTGYDTAKDHATAQQRQRDDERGKFLQERSTQFGDRLKKAAEADPDFATKIPKAVASATPLSGCVHDRAKAALIDPRSGQPVTFANVAAEAAFRSENPGALLLHLNAHSDDVQRILTLPQDEWLDALARLDGRLNAGTAPAAVIDEPEPNHISAAPEPATTLGSRPVDPGDPMDKAIKRGDTRTYRELRRQERAAGRR